MDSGFLNETPVSFDEWDSGKVKLSREVFRPCLVLVRGLYGQHSEKLVGFRGVETGTVLGTWADEVLEPIEGEDA
jgi:hypothetical protein